jgi:hypothetical protein
MMSKKTTTSPDKTVKPKAPRKASPTRARQRRKLSPEDQVFRDNPYEHDTPDYRRYVVAALYSLMEQQHREVPDYAADVMQRYVEFKLTMSEVVKRIDFAADNLS